jgi:hypothetical protein
LIIVCKEEIMMLHCLLILVPALLGVSQEEIPFPDALDHAAISVETLDSILDDALIIGNGDVNGLVYSHSGNLVLMLTKNDVWDARLDSRLDPPLPTLERIKELAFADWPNRGLVLPEGSDWKGPDSYQAHPYPCPRACGRLVLGGNSLAPVWTKIRSQGKLNGWAYRDGAAVMSIEGGEGASNGWACGPFDFTTDVFDRLCVELSGTENAQFYIDVMDKAGQNVLASKWQETPIETKIRTFELPRGKQVGKIILYAWTEDGKRAENRFTSLRFEGGGKTLPVDLGKISSGSTRAKLDLRRAVALVEGSKAGPSAAGLRALAQKNVFLVQSDAPASLLPFDSADVPSADTGETSGVSWIMQTIPGDLDWPGMVFCVALAEKGDLKAVAIVTSRESGNVKADAMGLAQETLDEVLEETIREHETGWRRFWAKSGIRISDPLLEQAWYRNLYFLRCVSKPGVICPGLFAGLINDSPAWHGDYHTNYNIQQTFFGCYSANHPELAEPYDHLIRDYFPRARWLARTIFDMGGAYYPHVLFAYEPPDPGRCRSPVGRQYIHHEWGFTLGVAGFSVQPLWWHYKYDPDQAFLDQVAYPAVRDVALFYADFIDQCERRDGSVVLGPSVSPEHWGWTPRFERNRNCAFDIAMVRYILEASVEGAGILGRDEDLVTRFTTDLGLLPDYPTTPDEPPIVVDVEGAPPINYNIAVPATPVFPGDVVTWRSTKEEQDLFTRTIDSLQWNGNNSMVMLAVARARLDMEFTIDWLKEEFFARLRPNGTLTLNRLGHHFNSFGHYTEQFAATLAVSELLLQSVGDVIRVFPAWPEGKNASFRSLRAQGGFLVSAEMSQGRVKDIEIESTAGGKLRIVSPWPRVRIRMGEEGGFKKMEPDGDGVIEVDTSRGTRLVITRW